MKLTGVFIGLDMIDPIHKRSLRLCLNFAESPNNFEYMIPAADVPRALRFAADTIETLAALDPSKEMR